MSVSEAIVYSVQKFSRKFGSTEDIKRLHRIKKKTEGENRLIIQKLQQNPYQN